MIKTRKEILSINPHFTEFILSVQLSYRPEPFEEGDKVDSKYFKLKGDRNGTATLTKEQADRINFEQTNNFESNLDKNPFPISTELDFIESQLIISSKLNATEYLNDLAFAIDKIREALNELKLIVLGVENIPWLKQENNYPPLANSLDYLKQRVDRNFNGGFLLDNIEIIEFIPHLFWMTRCNTSLTTFYFSYPNAKTMISICKYGVLHFEFYDQVEKLKILKVLDDFDFKELEYCGNPVEFDNFDGRRLII